MNIFHDGPFPKSLKTEYVVKKNNFSLLDLKIFSAKKRILKEAVIFLYAGSFSKRRREGLLQGEVSQRTGFSYVFKSRDFSKGTLSHEIQNSE